MAGGDAGGSAATAESRAARARARGISRRRAREFSELARGVGGDKQGRKTALRNAVPYLELYKYSALHQRFKLRRRCHHTQVYTCDADTCPFTHVTVPMHGPKRLAQSGLVSGKARHRPGVSQAGAESNIAARRPVRIVPPERKALSSSARTPHARTLRATPGLILRAPGRGLEPVGL